MYPKTSFDRKVRQVGYSLTVSLGKVLPENWRYVRLTPLEKTENKIILQIECLVRSEPVAPVAKDD